LQLRVAQCALPIIGCFSFSLAFPCIANAENTFMDWETQLYAGEYYEDSRIGSYSIVSKALPGDLSLTGEILFERYSDYDFAGVGGHLTWEATTFAKFGLVGSHAHEEYDYGSDFEDPGSEVVSSTVGLETELNHDPVTLVAQLGRIFNNTYNNDRYYLSMDAYYWGADYLWYARGATRRTKDYKEYTVEAYRSFFADVLPLTLYTGATKNDLDTKEELRTYRTSYDSVYTGGYIDFLTTSSSRWNLWLEAARQEEDTVFSIELNITFGPGADAPYISAFGFTQ